MNKETLEIFEKLLNGNKQIILGKSRQSGASWSTASLEAWKTLHKSFERSKSRKETIRRLFNI